MLDLVTFVCSFGKGESEKACRIVIIDDSLYEDDESFLVKLASPMGGRLGSFPQTEIVIAADFHDGKSICFWCCKNAVQAMDT